MERTMISADELYIPLEKPTGEVAEYFNSLVARTKELGADHLSIRVSPDGDVCARFILFGKMCEVVSIEDRDGGVYVKSLLPPRPDGCYWNHVPTVGANPEDVLIARLVGNADVH